jgi:hypothetical protein
MKKLIAILLIVSFIPAFNAFAISKNEPFKQLSKGLDNIVYGDMETPDNINETNTKGAKAFEDCTDDTKDGVGRGIARIVGGLWQIATFWYPTD